MSYCKQSILWLIESGLRHSSNQLLACVSWVCLWCMIARTTQQAFLFQYFITDTHSLYTLSNQRQEGRKKSVLGNCWHSQQLHTQKQNDTWVDTDDLRSITIFAWVKWIKYSQIMYTDLQGCMQTVWYVSYSFYN